MRTWYANEGYQQEEIKFLNIELKILIIPQPLENGRCWYEEL
jgi:hypothetical protein